MSLVEIRVPTIGESITEVTLSQWLKKDGDYVNVDEPICEFESDKASVEFPAEASGKLICVAKEGGDLAIGALVARIDTSISAGAVAYLRADSGSEIFAENERLFVIRATGNSSSIINQEGFIPKIF